MLFYLLLCLYPFDVKLACFPFHLHQQGLCILLRGGCCLQPSRTITREFLADMSFCELLLGCSKEVWGRNANQLIAACYVSAFWYLMKEFSLD